MSSPAGNAEGARLGVLLLTLRTVVVQVGVFVGQVVMARVLSPADFGVYAVAASAMQFFAFFGDGGLASALIQRREAPTDRELSSVFWMTAALGAVVVVLGVLLSFALPFLLPGMPATAPVLLRIIAFEMLLVGLRTVPTLLLEREVSFVRLAVVETVRDLSYYFVALPLVVTTSLGVLSIGVGILAEGTLGVLLAFAARPFRPRWVWDVSLLRPLFGFGIAYQGSRFVALLNDAALPWLAAARIGPDAAGLLNWARETSSFPMKLVVILSRVTFPVYGKLRDDEERVRETLRRAAYLSALLTATLVGMFLGMGRPFVRIVWSEKWLAVHDAWNVYLAGACFSFLAPLASTFADAKGHVRIYLRLASAWTAVNWILVFALAPRGPIVFAVANVAHLVLGFLASLVVLRHLAPGLGLVARLAPVPLSGAAAYGVATLAEPRISSWPTLVVALAAVVGASAAVAFVTGPSRFKRSFQLVPDGATEAAPPP